MLKVQYFHDYSTSDAVAFSYSHFGAGVGSIFITNVGCGGSESELQDCTSSNSVSNCDHNEDAGVRCQIEGTESCIL